LNNFNPDWLSPPGDTIADILKEQRVSPDELARRIGRTRGYAMDLIHGSAAIDEEAANLLSAALGASQAFWMHRETQYRAALAAHEAAIDPQTRAQWLAGFPVDEMKKLGWVGATVGASNEALQLLRFLGVPTIEAWNTVVAEMTDAVNLRTSQTFKSEPGAIAAWIREGELRAASIPCEHWNPKKFRATLNEIRSLTREGDPKVFLPKLERICAACGVAVVVLQAPKICKASGACRVLPRGVRFILLSARHLSDDHFWFTFFHEAGHLLLHGNRPLYIDMPEDEENPSTNDEAEANAFAADILIPPACRAEMLALPVDGRRVMRFARDVGIAPGIVVGQMQHFSALTRRQLNNLKRRFQWEQ
jgi:Zn-dependent peptidase ImmA (M78 family)/plasmid maintenance system antidote protein VapI